MVQKQLEDILQRKDVPDDVKDVIQNIIGKSSFHPRDKLLEDESERKYHSLLENLTDVVVETDSEGTFTFVSPQSLEIFGYAPKEVVGKNGFEFVHPDDIENIMQALEEALDGKHMFDYEYRAKHKNGKFISISSSGRVFGEGDDLKIIAVLRDISKHKFILSEFQKSEQKLRSFMEAATDSFSIWDSELRLTDINKIALSRFPKGTTKEKLIGRNMRDFQTDLVEIEKYQEVIKTGKSITVERPTPHSLFGDLILSVKAFKVGDGLGIITRDITGRIATETALREKEERLRVFSDSATENFHLFDSNLNNIDINKIALEELGLSKEEVLGKNIIELYPFLKETDRFDRYKEVLKTGHPIKLDSVKLPPEFGEKYVSISVFKVGTGLGLITTNITEKKQTEKIREKLKKRQQHFVWMTSHELRTPLTVVSGYIDFLHENIETIERDQRNKIFTTILSNLSRLERLTMDVSVVAQIGSGIFHIEKISLDFCAFLKESMKAYKNILGNQLKIPECSKELPFEGDKGRLQQVLDNLMNNAIKQTDSELRQILVRLKIDPKVIHLIITDNGAGIASENLERIFGQFISIETKFSTTGTGVGLFLSRKIIEAHEGTITAESDGKGSGATFTIVLPK